MCPEQIEKLRRQYTDQYVMVAGERPEFARFQGLVGQVKTVNMSGLALVHFDVNNSQAWHDIAIEHLKVVDKPPPKPVEKKPAAAAKPKPAPEKPAEKPAAGQ